MFIREVIKRLRTLKDKEMGTGVPLQQIASAEEQLGVHLPDSYKVFLSEIGWASIGFYEILGLGKDVPAHMDIIAVTKWERDEAEISLPVYLIPILNNGAGDLHCLDTHLINHGDCPVVYWNHELDTHQEPDILAVNFTFWLSKCIDTVSNQAED